MTGAPGFATDVVVVAPLECRAAESEEAVRSGEPLADHGESWPPVIVGF